MKIAYKDIVLGLLNAAVLPLLIAVMTARYIHSDLSALFEINQLMVFSAFPVVSIIVVFAICNTMLKHIRFPLVVFVYIAGGLLALHIYKLISGAQITDISRFGVYTLIGVAMVAGFRKRFGIILIPKLYIPGFVLLLLLIAGDVVLCFKKGDRFFPDANFDWRISLIALLAGLFIGTAAHLIFKLVKFIIQTDPLIYQKESICGNLDKIVYCRSLPSALPESDLSTPKKAFPKTVPLKKAVAKAAPGPSEKSPHKRERVHAVSNSTDKLLSQSDLPQIKVTGKKMNNSTANNTPPANDSKPSPVSDLSDTSWLDKHISATKQ